MEMSVRNLSVRPKQNIIWLEVFKFQTITLKEKKVKLKGQIKMEETRNKVKFYADCPDGTINKLFVYKNIKSLRHAKDILIKYIRKGYNIRSSYYEFLANNGTMMNVRINGINEIDFVEYETYAEQQINKTL
jgi:hypothetical protein